MFVQNPMTYCTEIDAAILPALVGSEKQIAWATTIRQQRIAYICNSFDNQYKQAKLSGVAVPSKLDAIKIIWEKNAPEIMRTNAADWISSR